MFKTWQSFSWTLWYKSRKSSRDRQMYDGSFDETVPWHRDIDAESLEVGELDSDYSVSVIEKETELDETEDPFSDNYVGMQTFDPFGDANALPKVHWLSRKVIDQRLFSLTHHRNVNFHTKNTVVESYQRRRRHLSLDSVLQG